MKKVALVAVMIILAAIVAAIVFTSITNMDAGSSKSSAEMSCLQQGYPEIKGQAGNWYCIKRSECEDIVIPLESLDNN